MFCSVKLFSSFKKLVFVKWQVQIILLGWKLMLLLKSKKMLMEKQTAEVLYSADKEAEVIKGIFAILYMELSRCLLPHHLNPFLLASKPLGLAGKTGFHFRFISPLYLPVLAPFSPILSNFQRISFIFSFQFSISKNE